MHGFWTQPCRSYRNFQVVYLGFTLVFAGAGTFYLFFPHEAVRQFSRVCEILGGQAYPEPESHIWRHLGVANVYTLAVMCFVMARNLRRCYPVLVPLLFMKSFNALLYLGGYVATPQYPGFLLVFVTDFPTALALWYFASKAARAIEGVPDADLSPAPSGAGLEAIGRK